MEDFMGDTQEDYLQLCGAGSPPVAEAELQVSVAKHPAPQDIADDDFMGDGHEEWRLEAGASSPGQRAEHRAPAATREGQKGPGRCEGKALNADEEFLRQERGVKVLSGAEVAAVQVIREVSEGSFGRVHLVRYRGRTAVRKTLKTTAPCQVQLFLWEARVMAELAGAGGAPRLLALSTCPPTLILEYAGVNLEEFLSQGCTLDLFLDTMAGLTQRLEEVHRRGFLHNDLKSNNITVTAPAARAPSRAPAIHLIDWGLACRVGQPFQFELVGLAPEWMRAKGGYWSPEVSGGLPLTPASDTFSIGTMMESALRSANNPVLDYLLGPLVAGCLHQDPARRPALAALAAELTRLKTLAPNMDMVCDL